MVVWCLWTITFSFRKGLFFLFWLMCCSLNETASPTENLKGTVCMPHSEKLSRVPRTFWWSSTQRKILNLSCILPGIQQVGFIPLHGKQNPIQHLTMLNWLVTVDLLQGHPCSRAHFNIGKSPFDTAFAYLLFQRVPFSLAHFRTLRWLPAAVTHLFKLNLPFFNHFNISNCPFSAASTSPLTEIHSMDITQPFYHFLFASSHHFVCMIGSRIVIVVV